MSRWGELPKRLGEGKQPRTSSRATDDTAPRSLSKSHSVPANLPPYSHSYLGTPCTSPTLGCYSVSQTNSYQVNKRKKKGFLTPSCSEPSSPTGPKVTTGALPPFSVPGLTLHYLGKRREQGQERGVMREEAAGDDVCSETLGSTQGGRNNEESLSCT